MTILVFWDTTQCSVVVHSYWYLAQASCLLLQKTTQKRPKPTMDYAEDGYSKQLFNLGKFIPVYMVDTAEDVNLFWGCSRT